MIDTDSKISDLRSKSGVDFDKAFLEGMIELHEANIEALELADTYSSNSDMISLVRSIISDHERHIRDMQELLGVS